MVNVAQTRHYAHKFGLQSSMLEKLNAMRKIFTASSYFENHSTHRFSNTLHVEHWVYIFLASIFIPWKISRTRPLNNIHHFFRTLREQFITFSSTWTAKKNTYPKSRWHCLTFKYQIHKLTSFKVEAIFHGQKLKKYLQQFTNFSS